MDATLTRTIGTLRESRDAIREGRVAIAEAQQELSVRYARFERRYESVVRTLQLLRTEGADADIQRLFETLDVDSRSTAYRRG